IEWEYQGNHLGKAELMVLDILANNNWDRPIYFVSPGQDGTLGLEPFLQLDGFAYKLVPIREGGNSYLTYGRIDSDLMYQKLMDEFEWGRMNAEDVYLDHFHVRTFSVIRFRNNFDRLAKQLLAEGKRDSALQVLDRCVELGPHEKLPWDVFMTRIIETYFMAQADEKAAALLQKFRGITEEHLDYFLNLEESYAKKSHV
ncbi:MAG: tetratricopeptide repeat protein, partial [Mariniphaga sp.]